MMKLNKILSVIMTIMALLSTAANAQSLYIHGLKDGKILDTESFYISDADSIVPFEHDYVSWVTDSRIVIVDGELYFRSTISLGDDVSKGRVAIVSSSVNDGTALINMLNGKLSYKEITESGSIDMKIPGDGSYKIILFSYSGDEIKETVSSDVIKSPEDYFRTATEYLQKYDVLGRGCHYDWGYGSMMHIRDVMTADFAVSYSAYNWYDTWSENSYLGSGFLTAQLTWDYYYKGIDAANEVISFIGDRIGFSGSRIYAHALRAMLYLDVARLYEFLPNGVYDINYLTDEGNSINYLTAPIIPDGSTSRDTISVPRATHMDMSDYIQKDLDLCKSLISSSGYTPSTKAEPSLATIYGLEARLHLWNAGYYEETGESYKAISEYALAIDAANSAICMGTNTPLTESEWLNTQTGFNTPCSSWLWDMHYEKDDDAVQTVVCNWTSWMSPEAKFGYAAAGPYPMIASELYGKISDSDFRKLSFKAPADSRLSGKEPTLLDDYSFGELPDYTGLKFRPGQGNTDNYLIAAVVDVPVMRIEELYFIRMEAAAHIDAQEGKSQLENFMKNYRYSEYSCSATEKDDIINEIMLQKSIEFWGEGLTFFDYKRLNMSVDRTLSTNFPAAERFKTEGRPAWMNFVIVRNAVGRNNALSGYNNPDPSDKYDITY